MKFFPKSVLLLMVLLVASACSATFEAAGLNADDAALLSNALAVDPTTAALDLDYNFQFNLSADGEQISISTNGRAISNPEISDSLITMAGTVAGVAELGGDAIPYDIEVRTIAGEDMYIKGINGLADPTLDDDTWLYVPADATTEEALSELDGMGLVQDGELDVTGLYSTLNNDLFGTAANYIEATRSDDVDGMAHFIVDLKIGDWVTSDEMFAGIEALAPMLAEESTSQEELDASLAESRMAMAILGMILDDGTYQLNYYVDPATGELSAATITLALMIDPATLGETGDPIILDLLLDVSFNTFGPDSVVTAPENFIKAEDL